MASRLRHDRDPVTDALAALAAAHGVATAYDDWRGRPVAVPAGTVRAVLAALDVDASTSGAVRAALEAAELAPWRRPCPPSVVAVSGRASEVALRLPAAGAAEVTIQLEDGSRRALRASDTEDIRRVDGLDVVRARLELPGDLPLGWHRLEVAAGATEAEATLVVAPERLDWPAGPARQWGWMVQLYAVRSQRSWGIGDFGDLTELVRWSGEAGAGLVLCNPMQAVTPVSPIEPSPYYPSSRRFANPLYLDVGAVPELALADADVRTEVDGLARQGRELSRTDRIDREAAWRLKMRALDVLHPLSRRPARATALAAYRREQGRSLEDFATFCALAERHGPVYAEWPAELHDPRSDAVRTAGKELDDRVGFHAWLQLLCEEQLSGAQAAAREAGMPIGVVHDLPVGADPGGADAWALQSEFARGVTVGAPADAFSPRGQDWQVPPLRPDRLAETGFAAYRDMVRSVLRHGGGVRLDHVMGLFRLYWVPEGVSPAEGTYVGYPADDLLGVLVLEAARAGAVVVGEDLGTVEPRVSAALRERGVLGSAVLWFERTADGLPKPSTDWPEPTMASLTTHDLPTAAGFLAGEHVSVREGLGLLDDPAAERALAERERAALLDLLRAERLVEEGADDTDVVVAMHAHVAAAPSRLMVAALGDAVGDLRQPNLPGTVDEYPNWRLPVAEPTPHGPRPLTLEQIRDHPAVRRLVEAIGKARPRVG